MKWKQSGSRTLTEGIYAVFNVAKKGNLKGYTPKVYFSTFPSSLSANWIKLKISFSLQIGPGEGKEQQRLAM